MAEGGGTKLNLGVETSGLPFLVPWASLRIASPQRHHEISELKETEAHEEDSRADIDALQ